ncbi:MAG: hypothetical protein JO171_16570 [Paludibacterium sp.]|uniref:hypothetical protein n=1 Tax=Paludibacterium sp. TaxID=1917523 RepID=UPI0025F8A583|nr:hypothetical protein [Paludibacterium sp.]MBV8048765.1 hypothetical protein [Paludibacterium sp.]
MARIRTIKPEFWTDEKVVELSAFARLLFIGVWNFSDDDGRLVYSPKRLKMQIFPADDVDCAALVSELERQALVTVYSVDGTDYLQVAGFAKHQKIDKRAASKLPPPPGSTDSPRVPPSPADGREGIKEGIKEGKGVTTTDVVVVASETGNQRQPKPEKPDCPHQEIIALYHDLLPQCPQVRDWTPARATQLRARWNEDKSRQNLDYWRRFFEYVGTCDFLVGRAGQKPFFADLEWMTKTSNFTKIRERKYENRGVA